MLRAWGFPSREEGASICLNVVRTNADAGIAWIYSYASDDKKKAYSVYDGPHPEARRTMAKLNGLLADHMRECARSQFLALTS